MSRDFAALSQKGPSVDIINSYYNGLSNVWIPALKPDDLSEGQSKSVQLLGQDILFAKMEGEIIAMPDLCPHFQAKLSQGTVENLCGSFESVVRCKYHGWAFNKKGECVEIPQLTDGKDIPKAANIKTYMTKISHDLVWVCASGAPKDAMPYFPETHAEDMVATPMQYSEPWNSSLVRMMLSVLDDYHFPWLHEGVLGTRDKPEPPKRKITWNGNEMTSAFQTIQPGNVTNTTSGNSNGSVVNYQMIVNMPNIIRLVKESEDGGKYVVHFYPQPISYDKTALFWRVTRNYDTGLDGEQKILEMERLIQSQDKELVGRQRPWLMPPTPIKGADDALTSYLQGLKKYDISPRI